MKFNKRRKKRLTKHAASNHLLQDGDHGLGVPEPLSEGGPQVLANVCTDINANLVEQGRRAHREANLLCDIVHLLRAYAFLVSAENRFNCTLLYTYISQGFLLKTSTQIAGLAKMG